MKNNEPSEIHKIQLGAFVWIEDGQAREEIDRLLGVMHDNGMKIARVAISWLLIEKQKGQWDFEAYDYFFSAAERHGIQVVATLTPTLFPPHSSENGLYPGQKAFGNATKKEMKLTRKYIEQVVLRYKDSPVLLSWIPLGHVANDPGPLPFAFKRYISWLIKKYSAIEALNNSWGTAFSRFKDIVYIENRTEGREELPPASYYDWQDFWREHLSWYMKWIVSQIRICDPTTPVHIVPDNLLANLAFYDFSSFEKMFDTAGALILPSNDFYMLPDKNLPLAVSATCNIIKNVLYPKPFWITGLQAGNNLFGGVRPLCPDEDDIAEWLWISIGAGARKIIMQGLNYSRQGQHSGEWALLNFLGNSSERFEKVVEIADIIDRNRDFFEHAVSFRSSISVLYSARSTNLLRRKSRFNDYPGRQGMGHLLSSLSFYQILMEIGFPCELTDIEQFNWENTSESNQVAILPHLLSVSSETRARIPTFVKNGNKLIVTGLTGLYDENETLTVGGVQPLYEFLGGRLKEIRLIDDHFDLEVEGLKEPLPAHLWQGEIEVGYGKPFSKAGQRITGIRNTHGRGETIWIPSLVAFGASRQGSDSLAAFLEREINGFVRPFPLTIKGLHKGVVMHALENEHDIVVVLINSHIRETIICYDDKMFAPPRLLYGQERHKALNPLEIKPGETMVLRFHKK